MNEQVFRALLDLVMVSDPAPLTPSQMKIIEEYLNEISVANGFLDWIEAYHRHV